MSLIRFTQIQYIKLKHVLFNFSEVYIYNSKTSGQMFSPSSSDQGNDKL